MDSYGPVATRTAKLIKKGALLHAWIARAQNKI
jgi:hypothetical protein